MLHDLQRHMLQHIYLFILTVYKQGLVGAQLLLYLMITGQVTRAGRAQSLGRLALGSTIIALSFLHNDTGSFYRDGLTLLLCLHNDC